MFNTVTEVSIVFNIGYGATMTCVALWLVHPGCFGISWMYNTWHLPKVIIWCHEQNSSTSYEMAFCSYFTQLLCSDIPQPNLLHHACIWTECNFVTIRCLCSTMMLTKCTCNSRSYSWIRATELQPLLPAIYMGVGSFIVALQCYKASRTLYCLCLL